MVDKITLGQRLKTLREEAGLSQQILADCISVDQSLISKLETGERLISSTQLEAICDVLCYPIGKLLAEKEDIKVTDTISYKGAKLSVESFKNLAHINRIFLNQQKMDKWDA